MKKGFTLVELSIVLVIIGLLIGGILVAQSMIHTAKIQNTVRLIQQMDTAVSNFKTKYNSWPGDSVVFGGDGNGLIQDSDLALLKFDSEIANAWVHLNQSGFDAGKAYTATIGSAFDWTSGTPNAPYLSIGPKTSVMILGAAPGTTNSYSIRDYTGTTAGAIAGVGNVYPKDALALDMKIDDGGRFTGYMFSFGAAGTCQVTPTYWNPLVPFVLNSATPGCIINIQALSSSAGE